MIVRAFGKIYWYTPLLLFIAGLVLWMPAFADPGSSLVHLYPANAPLYKLIYPLIHQKPLLFLVTAFLLLLIQALMTDYLASSAGFTDRYFSLTGLIYLLLLSSSDRMLSAHPIIFANLFLLLASLKVFKAYSKEERTLEIFNAALLTAIAGLIYMPSLVLFPVLIISLVVYRLFSMRSLLASFIGLATPYLFLGTWYVMAGTLAERMDEFYIELKPQLVLAKFIDTWGKLSFIVFTAFVLLATLRLWLVFAADRIIRVRMQVRVLLSYFLLSLLAYFLAGGYTHLHFAMVAIPLSVILSVFFYDIGSRRIREMAFYLFLAFIVAGRFLFW